MTPAVLAVWRRWHASGVRVATIAHIYGVAPARVRRALKSRYR